MRLIITSTALLLLITANAGAQQLAGYADSVRKVYNIPELGLAVVSAQGVMELAVAGYSKAGSGRVGKPTDRFRIGSNTKTVTGFIAAQLVRQGKLGWNTKFFSLYPELKAKSNPAYYDMTLLDLLSFRSRLNKYTYTDALPAREQFTGNEEEQRYQFVQWALGCRPAPAKAAYSFSNPGYTAAGMMLEKATGKSYKQLVAELGIQLGIDFHFGAPNKEDTLQPWGHNANLDPEPPCESYKLDWLQPAGNISVSLQDYAKFIQEQLKGLQGKSAMLSKEEFEFLHFGLPVFAVGWFWDADAQGRRVSRHTGNPGTFLSQLYVAPAAGRAYLLFANVQSPEAEKAFDIIYAELKRRYEQ